MGAILEVIKLYLHVWIYANSWFFSRFAQRFVCVLIINVGQSHRNNVNAMVILGLLLVKWGSTRSDSCHVLPTGSSMFIFFELTIYVVSYRKIAFIFL